MANFAGTSADLRSLELLAQGDSQVHRLHPLAKIASTVCFIAAVVSFGRYEIGALAPYFFYPAVLTPLAGTPWRLLTWRTLPALPFALFGALGNLVFDRAPMLLVGGVAVTGGMLSSASILLKTVLAVSAVLLLVATTPMDALARQLVRIKIPSPLVLQFAMTYRYLSVLVDEASTMYAAYALRSAGKKGIRMGDMGSFLGSLLLRSIERGRRVYEAMKCRGFEGAHALEAHSFESAPLRSWDLLYLSGICAAALSLRFFS